MGSGEVTPAASINVAEIGVWQQRRLIFRLHTLEEITAEFNRYNRKPQIHCEGEAAKTMRFSGVFDADDPETLLKYLASEGTFEFIHDGDNLLIRSRRERSMESHAGAPVTGTI